MSNLSTIVIGDVIFKENIPLAVLVSANSGETLGYLSPFRGYCFQVSNTVEGEGDLGSSIPIGLGNILHMEKSSEGSAVLKRSSLSWDSVRKELLKGQAALAIMNFIEGWATFDKGDCQKRPTSWGDEK